MTSRKKRLLFDVLDNVFEPADEFDRLPKNKKSRPKKKNPKKATKKASTKSKKKARAKTSKPQDRLYKSHKIKPESSGNPELSLTLEKAGAIGFVVIVLIAAAYQLGLSHGDDGILGENSAPLSRDAKPGNSRFDRSVNHFAIKATTLPYSEFTIKSAKQQAREYLTLLWDAGYTDATHTYMVDPSEKGRGKIVIWLGHSKSKKPLKSMANKVRSLQSIEGAPFKRAYITLFSDPKKKG